MIVQHNPEQKELNAAFEALRTAQTNFLTMPLKIYLDDLHMAMARYQNIWQLIQNIEVK